MATFWLLAGVLILIAVSFVLIPLLRGTRSKPSPAADRINLTLFKDQLAELEADVENGVLSDDQLEEGRLDLERRLLDETHPSGEDQPPSAAASNRILALLIALILPATILFLYNQLGRIDVLEATAHSEAMASVDPMSSGQLSGVVQGLADRLKAQPNDPKGWMMLGRSYTQFGEHSKAANAYAMAYGLIGNQPDVMLAYADSLAMANGGRFGEKSIGLISRALEAAPEHPQAIWLAGTIAYRQCEYSRALKLWERLLALAPAGSDMARAAADNAVEARALLRGEDPTEDTEPE